MKVKSDQLLPSDCFNWKIYCDGHFSLSSTTAVQYEFHIYFTSFHWQEDINLAPNLWLHSSVGRASNWCRGGHGFKSHWSPDIFRAASFQLLQLENLLQWSLFTFIYNHSTIWISYIFHNKSIPVNTSTLYGIELNFQRTGRLSIFFDKYR